MVVGTGHIESGSRWTPQDAERYRAVRHGPDGSLFLDPIFLNFLDGLPQGSSVIDIGAGAAPWSVYIGKNGLKVVALDINRSMLNQGKKAIADEELGTSVFLEEADAARIPHGSGAFDNALSTMVGCNLPDLSLHFTEAYRVLKPGGLFIVTAPNSFLEVFTDGQTVQDKIRLEVDRLVSKANEFDPRGILNQLQHVLRATFVVEDGAIRLVTDESALFSGQPIWRRIPGLTVPNYYHHVQEYMEKAKEVGFETLENIQSSFDSEDERTQHNNNNRVPSNKQLGPEYVGHPPFAVFLFKKPLS